MKTLKGMVLLVLGLGVAVVCAAQVDLGIKTRSVTEQDMRMLNLPSQGGVLITETTNNSLEVNDVIVKVQGRPVANQQEFAIAVQALDTSSLVPVSIVVLRAPKSGVIIPKEQDILVFIHRQTGNKTGVYLLPSTLFGAKLPAFRCLAPEQAAHFPEGLVAVNCGSWIFLRGNSLALVREVPMNYGNSYLVAIVESGLKTFALFECAGLKKANRYSNWDGRVALVLMSLDTGEKVYEFECDDYEWHQLCFYGFTPYPGSPYIAITDAHTVYDVLGGRLVAKVQDGSKLPDLAALPPTTPCSVFAVAPFSDNAFQVKEPLRYSMTHEDDGKFHQRLFLDKQCIWKAVYPAGDQTPRAKLISSCETSTSYYVYFLLTKLDASRRDEWINWLEAWQYPKMK